jgi:DNA-binding NarL/FixJ family response regulator
MWRRVAIYGAALGAGALALQWLDYQRMTRVHGGEILIALLAAGFLALGVFIGRRLFGPTPATAPGNPPAVAALGISPREMEVLAALARGQSNKEIAAALQVSPNTVKTHVARLFEKLGARRRTEAIARARDLGLMG